MEDEQNQKSVDHAPQQPERVRRWVMSPEGLVAIAASLDQAHNLAAQFREAERVDPDTLHKPITL